MPDGASNHEHVLRACEAAVLRLTTDRHYFAKPSRTLFNDIRVFFPMCAQGKVLRVGWTPTCACARSASQPATGFDLLGNRLECRATTRSHAQRAPLPHNGYCPWHQHLHEQEEREARLGRRGLSPPEGIGSGDPWRSRPPAAPRRRAASTSGRPRPLARRHGRVTRRAAVLLLHGWPQHWWMWRRVIAGPRDDAPRLARTCAGSAGRGAGRPLLEDGIAADVERRSTQLGLETGVLVGHDWGGRRAPGRDRAPDRDRARLAFFNMIHPGWAGPFGSLLAIFAPAPSSRWPRRTWPNASSPARADASGAAARRRAVAPLGRRRTSRLYAEQWGRPDHARAASAATARS